MERSDHNEKKNRPLGSNGVRLNNNNNNVPRVVICHDHSIILYIRDESHLILHSSQIPEVVKLGTDGTNHNSNLGAVPCSDNGVEVPTKAEEDQSRHRNNADTGECNGKPYC
jgi:hypothetical protein